MKVAAPRQPRVAFVTIGQSPRTDVVPQMMADLGLPAEVEEFGILDALGPDAIAAEPVGDTPEHFAGFLAQERKMWADVIKTARITLD
jgi:protein AroM